MILYFSATCGAILTKKGVLITSEDVVLNKLEYMFKVSLVIYLNGKQI